MVFLFLAQAVTSAMFRALNSGLSVVGSLTGERPGQQSRAELGVGLHSRAHSQEGGCGARAILSLASMWLCGQLRGQVPPKGSKATNYDFLPAEKPR